MTTPIHPDALKEYRSRKHWTQEQLAEATKGRNKVSLPTIKRIESAKGDAYPARERVAEGLARALNVKVEDLTRAPLRKVESEEHSRKFGHRPKRVMLDEETALAFSITEDLYGIPFQSQIEMAPLFTVLLAEASLAWRRDRVAEIEEVAARLWNLGGGHFSFANAAYRAQEGAAGERLSIERRDLFGEHVSDEAFELGYDPSKNNPFADFLQDLAMKVAKQMVSFDNGWGWKTSEGFPEYRIGADVIEQLTGNDSEAIFALSRGHVRVSTIPKELLGDEKRSERVQWMIAQVPEAELAERKSELFSALA